ncbi:MAG: endonuclease III [Dehalococcoidia bacterium]
MSTTYGTPIRDPLPLNNKPDPLDELIYILLTVMTEFGVDGVYETLRREFPTWADVANTPGEGIARILQPIGLSTQRARRMKALLAEIINREGAADLRRLHRLSDAEAEAYLCTLPGVGKKVARCVMLYSLGRDVFPVDAHVLRVLKRLGLAEPELTLQKAQDTLQNRVPDVLRFTLHVNLVVHGRTICRARKPNCEACVLAPSCPSAISAAP